MNYLKKGTRLDISYSTHLCAQFCKDLREPHVAAVEHAVSYLCGTKQQGIILRPDKNESFNVYVDMDFSGAWKKGTATEDPGTA
eukprot:12745360-Ditylum_brightwellii.AAC.1